MAHLTYGFGKVVASVAQTPAELEAANANYVGGDIITGANTPVQTLIRPRLALDPYGTGTGDVFICSAATPPGAGAHGMGGYNAAQSVLRSSISGARNSNFSGSPRSAR